MSNYSDDKTTVVLLKQKVKGFVDEREWGKFHNPKNLSTSIAIEASELMELFQWVSENELETLSKDKDHIAKVEAELADVIIYCLSLANTTNIDISKAVINKIERNTIKYPADEFRGIYKKS